MHGISLVLVPCLVVTSPPAVPRDAVSPPPQRASATTLYDPKEAHGETEAMCAEAARKISEGDDEAAIALLSAALEREPSLARAYELRADAAGRLAEKQGPGAALHAARADDLSRLLALQPDRSDHDARFRELQQAHARAQAEARREEKRRRLVPASMTLGLLGGGATIASVTLLGLARTNVGNEHTKELQTIYGAAFLGLGLAALGLGIGLGIMAGRSSRNDAKATRLYRGSASGRWGVEARVGAGGLQLRF